MAVRDWNFWLSACASLPFCALKPDPEAAADELPTAEGVGVAWAGEPDAEEGAGGEFCAAPLPAPLPPGTPGDWTRASSCCPSGIGPEVCAGQLPGGFRLAFWPKGIVPGWPAWLPSANLLGFTPWNWHWKSPLSSEFRGACWQ